VFALFTVQTRAKDGGDDGGDNDENDGGQGGPSFSSRCLSFAPEKFIHNSTRTVLEFVPSGTNLTFPDNVASCGRPSQVVSTELCRIALSIPTSNRSSFTFELWVPENWSERRFISSGNGGIDGCMYSVLLI